MANRISLTVDGQSYDVPDGCSVAAGVMQSTGLTFRQSVGGEARGPLCGMGVCFECRVTIDGEAHQRSCLLSCRDGMQVETGQQTASFAYASGSERRNVECDVLVVGAGPGGVSAAVSAAEQGRRVVLLDENAHVGGQIWRYDASAPTANPVDAWRTRLVDANVTITARAAIVAQPATNELLADVASGPVAIRYTKLILACGARERFLPFPGWTLPGVFGAGGLQALVKSGYDIANKKIVVAGTGPLLLAVGAYLCKRGADVTVLEQTPRDKLLRFAASLAWRQPSKLWEAFWLQWHIGLFSYHPGCWVVRAEGAHQVHAVMVSDGQSTWSLACDALACGYGLVPNLELARLLGCAIDAGYVRVDASQQTSVPGVYAVGELTGIGGVDKALVEGQIAGWTAAGRHDLAADLTLARDTAENFVAALDETFSLRDELRLLPDKDTIVCRCEDVAYGPLQSHRDGREAKLQTRCGMGPCQGRICGPAVEFLFGWHNDSVRPPILPTTFAKLI